MTNPLTKLAGKIGQKLGISLALSWIRAAAEGKKGPQAKALYWGLAGYKTWTGVGLAIVATAAGLYGAPPVVAEGLGTAAGLLISAGLLDKAWRTYRPEALTNSGVYRLLAAHPAEVATAFSGAAAWLGASDCTLGAWCHRLLMGELGLAAAAIYLGLLDAAWKAPAPYRRPSVEEFLRRNPQEPIGR